MRYCQNTENKELFKGIVEIDEVYIGGKRKGKYVYHKGKIVGYNKLKKGKGTKKDMVLGIVERGKKGRSKTIVIKNNKFNTKIAAKIISKYVDIKNSKIMTDEYGVYNFLDKLTYHGIVKYSAKQYVDGQNHTNSIEGYWRKPKDSMRADFNYVGKQYLQSYFDEFDFKHNNRNLSGAEKFKKLISGVRCN